MTLEVPFRSSDMSIQPDWIDYNGHLNMAYYSVLFDRGTDELFFHFGLGENSAKTTGLSTFTADFRIRYLREVKLADQVYVTSQVIDFDSKRFHTFHELRHIDGWLSATAEALTLHVDLSGPKVVPMQNTTLSKVESFHKSHAKLEIPEALGKPIGIPKTR